MGAGHIGDLRRNTSVVDVVDVGPVDRLRLTCCISSRGLKIDEMQLCLPLRVLRQPNDEAVGVIVQS